MILGVSFDPSHSVILTATGKQNQKTPDKEFPVQNTHMRSCFQCHSSYLVEPRENLSLRAITAIHDTKESLYNHINPLLHRKKIWYSLKKIKPKQSLLIFLKLGSEQKLSS